MRKTGAAIDAGRCHLVCLPIVHSGKVAIYDESRYFSAIN